MVTIGDLENNEIESIHIEGITNIPLIKGEQGEKGDKGDKGETNNIKIGTVETGEKASATLEGESPNQILNLVLPKGDKGEQGEPGIKPVKGIDYFTEEEIQEIKSNILDQVNQFSVLVVEELPNDNIDEHTIYFVPKTKTEQNDVYDEFIYINNGWEHIGTTEVDLSSYYKKDEIDAKLEAVEGNEVYIGNPAEAPNSAKIIVEEDDFVEGSTLGKAEVYVGAEEPITGEKVWFRKGKNLFNTYSSDISYYLRNTDKEKYIINNSNSITVEGNGITWNRVEITISNLKPNTKYTINSIVTNTTQGYTGLLCDYGNNSVQYVTNKEKFNAKITIVTDENGKVKLQFYTNYSSTTQNSSAIFSEIQLEEGEKATTYKAYIEPKLFVRNSNGVYEEFTKKSEGLVNYTSYIEFNDKVTKIYNCTAYKKDNILFLNIDLEGNFPEGETVLGTIKRKLKLTAFGSGRLRTTNSKIIPATYIGLSEGAFRVHTTTTGTATTGNIILALEE